MPIKVQSGLPAIEILENENIFVMDENRALSQDIRPLKIAILNLMPTKIIDFALSFYSPQTQAHPRGAHASLLHQLCRRYEREV